ncbi:MAG: class I SAM-dependent methyltransferase [Sediminicola sp.]
MRTSLETVHFPKDLQGNGIGANGGKENVAPKERELSPGIMSALRLDSGIRVLELPCGQGIHMVSIVSYIKDMRYFGLDADCLKIKDAQDRYAVYTHQRKALFQDYEGERIPYVARFFHRILCWDITILEMGPEQFLAECHRVLAADGILVLLLANKDEKIALDYKELARKVGFRFLGTEAILNGGETKGLEKGYRMVSLQKPLLPKIMKDELIIMKRG